MCGIVGAVGLRGTPAPELVRRAMDALAHRGPDSDGLVERTDVWLGFRRLSIQDLRSVADQPMIDEPSGVGLVFNGEIYNFVELRTQLEGLGHRFRTLGDTEVLLRGWLQWGEGVFERCNGMWAVAIDDPRREGVVLCRDRFGEKPLFYGADAERGWWFASEPAALRAVGVGTGRIDRSAAAGFLLLGDAENPASSWFEGISQLPPGGLIDLTSRGPARPRRWWMLGSFVSDCWAGAPASDEEVRDRLRSSVRLRLRSDVAVGSSLSGGLDSSTIVTTLRDVAPDRELHTFTASFPNEPIDEWDQAAALGERAGVVMHRVLPTPEDFVRDLDLLLDRQGGPIESPTVYAQWCVMRTAHEHGITVLLDGQGADETWGGYPKYVGTAIAGAIRAGHVGTARATLSNWRRLGAMPRPDVRQIAALGMTPTQRRRAIGAAFGRSQRLFGDAIRDAVVGDPVASPVGEPLAGPLLRRAAQVDLSRVILPRLLRYADRNSMAWSREVRLPFLDPGVIEVALRSDWAAGLERGWTKEQLRRVGSAAIPDSITWCREKTGYEVPDSSWLRRPDVRDAVADAGAHLTGMGVITEAGATQLSPWRVLTLGRFVGRYGLAA